MLKLIIVLSVAIGLSTTTIALAIPGVNPILS
jgi:hypothetical protein